jgi:hypothetical protein
VIQELVGNSSASIDSKHALDHLRAFGDLMDREGKDPKNILLCVLVNRRAFSNQSFLAGYIEKLDEGDIFRVLVNNTDTEYTEAIAKFIMSPPIVNVQQTCNTTPSRTMVSILEGLCYGSDVKFEYIN